MSPFRGKQKSPVMRFASQGNSSSEIERVQGPNKMVTSEDRISCFSKTRISLKGKETKKAKKHVIQVKQEHSHSGDLSSGRGIGMGLNLT